MKMFKWIQEFFESSRKTKYFALNWAVYGIAIIVSTAYCYGRLDFVRSYKTDAKPKTAQIEQKQK
jgi:hypothetical protein